MAISTVSTSTSTSRSSPSHSPAIPARSSKSNTLPDDAKDTLFAEVDRLKASGASSEEIKAYVDSELEAHGVRVPSGAKQSGQMVDMMA